MIRKRGTKMKPVIQQEYIGDELRWMLSYVSSKDNNRVFLTLESRTLDRAKEKAAHLLNIEESQVDVSIVETHFTFSPNPKNLIQP